MSNTPTNSAPTGPVVAPVEPAPDAPAAEALVSEASATVVSEASTADAPDAVAVASDASIASAAIVEMPSAPAVATKTGPGYLFVCGCPRSGTTAMWRLLAAARQVVIGVERYALRMDRIDPSMFTRERFLRVEEGDTFYNDLEGFSPYYKHVPVRFKNARWIGDKSPRLYDWFDNLKAQFPGATVLIMYRNIFDVASSYKRRAQDETYTFWGREQGVQAALTDWTRSLQAYLKHREDGRLDLVPVCYERLLSRHEGLETLFEHLGLPVDDAVRAQYERMKSRSPDLESSRDRVLSTDEVFDLCMRAPFGAYRQVIDAAP